MFYWGHQEASRLCPHSSVLACVKLRPLRVASNFAKSIFLYLPQVLPASDLKIMLRSWTLVAIAIVCAEKESKLSKVTPSNSFVQEVRRVAGDLVGESCRFLAVKKRERQVR